MDLTQHGDVNGNGKWPVYTENDKADDLPIKNDDFLDAFKH